MEFSLDDNRAGAGSSILLSPEVVAIRAKLIEACDGKTFAETIEFLKQLLEKEQDEQKRLGILAARVYVLRQRIMDIQEKEDAALSSKFTAPEQDFSNDDDEDSPDEKNIDDENDNNDWIRLRITENSIVKGVRFPKGVIVDVHHEEADVLIEAGKAEMVAASSEELNDSSKVSDTQSTGEGEVEAVETEETDTEETETEETDTEKTETEETETEETETEETETEETETKES